MPLLTSTLKRITAPSPEDRQKAEDRLRSLAMPPWALGDLMDCSLKLSAMSGHLQPKVKRKCSVVMAGDHGVLQEGVSDYPKEVTLAILKTMAEGKAGINALCDCADASLHLVDMGMATEIPSPWRQKVLDRSIGKGSQNIAIEPAMSEDDARHCLEKGIEVALEITPEADVFGIGELGMGNTTPATAIACVVTSRPAKELTGPGTGLSPEKLQHKVGVVQKAVDRFQGPSNNGLALLQELGGFEIGGMAGFILGCAAQQKPVLIDGLISTVAALIAQKLCPHVNHYVIASHCGAEPAHRVLLDELQLKPLLQLQYRLGEGSGAASAFPLIDQAAALLTQVATLDEALAL